MVKVNEIGTKTPPITSTLPQQQFSFANWQLQSSISYGKHPSFSIVRMITFVIDGFYRLFTYILQPSVPKLSGFFIPDQSEEAKEKYLAQYNQIFPQSFLQRLNPFGKNTNPSPGQIINILHQFYCFLDHLKGWHQTTNGAKVQGHIELVCGNDKHIISITTPNSREEAIGKFTKILPKVICFEKGKCLLHIMFKSICDIDLGVGPYRKTISTLITKNELENGEITISTIRRKTRRFPHFFSHDNK